MAGASFEIDSAEVRSAIGQVVHELGNPAPLFQIIIEYLHRAHRNRFIAQRSPDNKAWQALSPRYLKRKHKNRNKILHLRGHLRNTLRGQYDDAGLEFGTDRVYGAIHHFGGDIKKSAAQREVFFKRTKAGVGNRFVKKASSNFAQQVNVGAHSITMPARPWLGTSKKDNQQILLKTQRYLQKALAKR
ncbi:MAG: phage virion morphogenesis protein [Kordiimonadaceae bacterium]|nr:phage virion morphogenesis protein [Kordiimonadaceae bacterium]PCJ37764.1 MAG: virion morphogenesis protein [Cellvibrionales bacterium]